MPHLLLVDGICQRHTTGPPIRIKFLFIVQLTTGKLNYDTVSTFNIAVFFGGLGWLSSVLSGKNHQAYFYLSLKQHLHSSTCNTFTTCLTTQSIFTSGLWSLGGMILLQTPRRNVGREYSKVYFVSFLLLSGCWNK